MEEKRCAVVTGGNKGIGLEICRQLALNNIQVILTARNESRGIEAVKKLNDSGLPNVIFHRLDVEDPTSTPRLVEFIETHSKKLDILVNNAGISGIRFVADKIVYNAKGEVSHIKEALVPLLQRSKLPRIVNITSIIGLLSLIPNDKLDDIDNLTEERIDDIIQCFLRDFKADKLRENGWPLKPSAYKLSKSAINAYTRLMAKKFQNRILVNCVHPGLVKTDMTLNWGIDVEEGAKGPVMAALLPDDGPSGVYFNQTEIAPFK